jgi:hypothetical protein
MKKIYIVFKFYLISYVVIFWICGSYSAIFKGISACIFQWFLVHKHPSRNHDHLNHEIWQLGWPISVSAFTQSSSLLILISSISSCFVTIENSSLCNVHSVQQKPNARNFLSPKLEVCYLYTFILLLHTLGIRLLSVLAYVSQNRKSFKFISVITSVIHCKKLQILWILINFE